MSSASFLNFAMLLVLMTLSWSQTGKAAPTSDDSDQEAFRPAVSIEENACDSSIKMVEVGSSDQYGCYPGKNGSNATMPQCWRTCNVGEDGCTWSKWWDFKWNNYHGWCNIAKEKCTKSLHKSAGCPMKHKHTWDYGGHTCPKGPLDPRANGPTGQRANGPKGRNDFFDQYGLWYMYPCDFRTGKRYGCEHGFYYKCWRSCDQNEDLCLKAGWCYTDVGACSKSPACLKATTAPCTG